ncbi:MAG: UDP-N-acetylmuramate--L-alanine ligase [Sedimentisphaerales bacterium]
MKQPNIQTYSSLNSCRPLPLVAIRGDCGNPRVKAAHKYEIVDADGGLGLLGKKFHFIGAGGIGMSGLAQLLMKNSAIVTGSDQTTSSTIDRLCRMGAKVKIGHHPDNLRRGTNAVVISAAIKEDNPELKLARKRKYKVYKYAQMLGRLMNRYDGIAVAGMHGKSTTSGWLSYLLRRAAIDVNFIVGAEVSQLGSSSGVGDSKYFIAEACEYDRSFLNLRPKIACVLNIEQDHLDYYKDEDEIVEAFGQFALQVKPGGLLIANGQDANVAKIIRQLGAELRCEIFGLNRDCNFCAANIQLIDGLYAFDVYHNNKLLGRTRISLPGRHNILNALAVVAMAVNVGIPSPLILHLLPTFTGIDRRLMLKEQFIVRDASPRPRSGQARVMRRTKSIRNTQYAVRNTTITILDDYAHHPTEIRATLEAIRQRYQPRRIWCVFQPHQYSRTRFLLDDFAESFKLADVIIVPEIYFVRDSLASKKEINSQILVERMRANGTEAVFIDNFGAICDYLKRNVTAGDLVVTMGAGDIWKVADEYIQRLREDS